MTPILAAALPSVSSMLSVFVWVAVACLVIWGILRLLRAAGISIPQPVWTVLTVLGGVFLILLIARFFGIIA